ncbi:MAG: hypothetical protein PHR06_05225 [Candidatus Cloacimonetes bacterium]|nr:hypothetical protein [Candidatus Cloacimonadota bacterium]
MKKSENPVRDSLIITKVVSFIFDFFKQTIRDYENTKKIKAFDKMDEQFSTIEHLLIKQEKMLHEQRKMIEELKNKFLISSVIIIALSITVLIQVIR